MARQTFQPISKLSLEKVHNQTIISSLPIPPFTITGNLHRKPLQLGFLRWRVRDHWLNHDTVQILMYAINQETKEFLRVVLV